MTAVASTSTSDMAEDIQVTTGNGPQPISEDDQPPAYVDIDGRSSKELKQRPTNNLVVLRDNGGIKGEYIVDRSLHISPSLLPLLVGEQSDAGRKSAQLNTKNGSIDVSLLLVDSRQDHPPMEPKGRASVLVSSENGSIMVKIKSSPNSVPCRLHVSSQNGSVAVALPRSYRGPLTMTARNGALTASRSIHECLTPFSEVDRTRLCFIGEWMNAVETARGWNGDECVIDAYNGGIAVRFVDDPETISGRDYGSSFHP